MHESSFFALFLVGLLGGTHCVGMCGGIVGALSVGGGNKPSLHLAYSAGRYLRHKPAAIVTSARRAGTTTAIEAMEKIPQFYEMPLVSSTYWPMVHGTSGDQVALDEEGCQIMRNLGTNMAWLLKCIEAGKAAGVEVPTAEGGKRTNFIR